MSSRPAFALFLLLVGLAAGGCDRPRLNVGAECGLNSDCAEPFVCGITRCRRQCVDSRDCGAGLLCLAVEDESLGGVCQLELERVCSLDSDCPEPLVCRFGTCTTECVEDRDCTGGATCEATERGQACSDPAEELCIYDSDCEPPLVCGPSRRCQIECVADRDCPRPRVCIAQLCQLGDGG